MNSDQIATIIEEEFKKYYMQAIGEGVEKNFDTWYVNISNEKMISTVRTQGSLRIRYVPEESDQISESTAA